jgi:Tfp pilus assembly protein PilF
MKARGAIMRDLWKLTVVVLCAAAMAGCRSQGVRAGREGPEQDTELARRENDRAYALLRDGKYDDAEKALKSAVAADVMFGAARNNLGLVYYHQNKLYEAAWEFQNAIKLLPYQPEPRNNLGLVLEKAGKIDGAAESYDLALEMQPDNPEFLGNLARARVRRGDRDERTRHLLEEVLMRDTRPVWRDWAQTTLFRLSHSGEVDQTPATRPSGR